YDRHGIFLLDTFNVTVTGNQIADCQVGIVLCGAQYSTITGNNLTHTDMGIYLGMVGCNYYTENNLVSENNVVLSGTGIFTDCYGPSNITRNHLRKNSVGVQANGETETISYNEIMDCERGIVNVGRTGERFICGNMILNCTFGIDQWGSSVMIFKNHIADCEGFGIRSKWCNVSENDISNCGYGVVGGGFVYGNNITGCYYGIGDGWG
ncbi:MAG: NosD domain-containing protein, partial [Candidatus Bathyarchaeia archaeon]